MKVYEWQKRNQNQWDVYEPLHAQDALATGGILKPTVKVTTFENALASAIAGQNEIRRIDKKRQEIRSKMKDGKRIGYAK